MKRGETVSTPRGDFPPREFPEAIEESFIHVRQAADTPLNRPAPRLRSESPDLRIRGGGRKGIPRPPGYGDGKKRRRRPPAPPVPAAEIAHYKDALKKKAERIKKRYFEEIENLWVNNSKGRGTEIDMIILGQVPMRRSQTWGNTVRRFYYPSQERQERWYAEYVRDQWRKLVGC